MLVLDGNSLYSRRNRCVIHGSSQILIYKINIIVFKTFKVSSPKEQRFEFHFDARWWEHSNVLLTTTTKKSFNFYFWSTPHSIPQISRLATLMRPLTQLHFFFLSPKRHPMMHGVTKIIPSLFFSQGNAHLSLPPFNVSLF